MVPPLPEVEENKLMQSLPGPMADSRYLFFIGTGLRVLEVNKKPATTVSWHRILIFPNPRAVVAQRPGGRAK